MKPAVFLDRDGTIIEDRGDLSDPEQIVFFNDTVPALLRLQEKFYLFIVTNQSGVANGTITMDDVERINSCVSARLAGHNIRIVETYVCPHNHNDDCKCIKPKPYFLRKAEKDYSIDLRNSFVIGDHPHDLEFGENAGAKAVYVLTGHGKKHQPELPENAVVVPGIREAAEYILEGVREK